jgi:ACS family glucarate transporter-like MFS transporter
MNTGGQIGGAVTATLTAMIAEHYGWTASFLTAAGLCVFGSLLWLVVNPNARLVAERADAQTHV